MDEDRSSNEVCIVDSSKLLKKEGVINICEKYGSIKNIIFRQYPKENKSYIEFEDPTAADKLLDDKRILPNYLEVNLIYDNKYKCMENDKIIKNSEVIHNLDTMNIDEERDRQSMYLGPNISVSSLIEESKLLKLNGKIKPYNLENDDLFGKPLTSKWEKLEKFDFGLNNLHFLKRFENCTGGKIKIEKKLGPSIFTGWTTIIDDGENVKNILKSMSDDIENSEVLNVNDLKRGMLVGAFDSVTKLYGRGYIALVAGNSVNVAMSDYGRVINTSNIRALPDKHTQKSAYSFKAYTKDQCVQQLKEKCYAFKVRSASSQRIVLTLFDENKEIKVQLKTWQPSVEEFGVPYIDFKSGSFVELLKLKDMNSLYLRSKEKHHFEFLFSCWNQLALYCFKTPQFLNREPLYGEIIGFKSTKSKNYARGRIHKYIGDNIYCVKHMDNPLKENIKFSEMIELQFEHKIMPVSFIKVGLKDALNYPIQYDAEQFVKHIIGVRLSVRFDESKLEGWKYVDLQVTIVKESLNKILFKLADPSWIADISSESRLDSASDFFKYHHLLNNKLEENSVVSMKFVVFDDGIFYMRDNNFGKSFTLLSDMIKDYCDTNVHPYLPHNEELCLGKLSDGNWYRVVCDSMRPGELTKVHSVDLGNVAYLNSTKIKKLPGDLLFHPSHAYPCILETSKQLNQNKLKLLKEYENTDCEFTVIKQLEYKNYYSIRCTLFEDILS